jgi:hypothetical protein
MLEVFGNVMNVITMSVGAIAGISLVVGGIGILTMMWIAVGERTHEIGLVRAFGGSRRQVRWLFLGEAAALGVVGGVAGLAGASACAPCARAVPACRCTRRRSRRRRHRRRPRHRPGSGVLRPRAASWDPVEALRTKRNPRRLAYTPANTRGGHRCAGHRSRAAVAFPVERAIAAWLLVRRCAQTTPGPITVRQGENLPVQWIVFNGPHNVQLVENSPFFHVSPNQFTGATFFNFTVFGDQQGTGTLTANTQQPPFSASCNTIVIVLPPLPPPPGGGTSTYGAQGGKAVRNDPVSTATGELFDPHPVDLHPRTAAPISPRY